MSDPVTRLNAALAGRYAIERELGEGGMATVYLADDLKHERKVALKVLKPELAAVVGAERFLAEIKTTANLQHPHILPLHDSGEADGFLYYVMPYVEGETLRDRIDRDRQLPVDEAVRIATAVANALDHAHRNGVIHRDIKPANILLQDGEPVVADFGIALAVGAAGGARLTETGLSVGTPFYMSPEQATGDQVVGPSSDTYSLGSVLFEMLVGEPPYPGATAQAVLGKIIMGKPVSATEQRPAIPANIDGALRCALEKVPADRFASTQDFGKALSDPGFLYGDAAKGPAKALRGPARWMVGALAVAAAGFAGAFAWSATRPVARPIVRFELTVSEDTELSPGAGVNLAVSPDGTMLMYRGPSGIMLRDLAHLETRLVRGTESARNPVFSRDGRSLAFSSLGSLKTVSLLGGPPATIVGEGVPDGGGGVDWGEDGMLYFVTVDGAVRAVPSTGGPTVSIAVPDGDSDYAWVDALPDGRGLLFTSTRNSPSESQIVVHDLESGETRVILPGTMARYARSGHIVFAAEDGTLYAAPFDLGRLEVTGPQISVGEVVDVYAGSASQFAISESGTLFYVVGGGATATSTPMWVERGGEYRPIDPDWTVQGGRAELSLALSVDGTRLAVSSMNSSQATDLWVKQLDSGPLSRLTFEGSRNDRPFWFVDGSSVAFISTRGGGRAFWRRRADGSDTPELMFSRQEVLEGTFSPAGDWIVFRETVSGSRDISARRLGADSAYVDLLSSPANEWGADISPDGGWIAYVSDESGRDEVYVRPFPDVGQGRWQISTDGARSPVWAHSGEELFYRALNGGMMSAAVSLRPTFSIRRRPTLLFEAPTFVLGNSTVLYDVTADDQRFVMFSNLDQGAIQRLLVTQNWTEEVLARTAN